MSILSGMPPLADMAVWALVLARVAGLVWIAPAWGAAALGIRLRLALAALLTALILPGVYSDVASPSTPVAWALALVVEAIVGAGLGLSAALVIAGARQAGEIVGMQAGLSAASLFDPEAGDELTPLAHLYGLVALAAFLALDGPLTLVGSLVESYRALPAGAAGFTTMDAVDWAFGRVGWALALALRAAAPAALALILAGLALGLLSRAAASLPLVGLTLTVRAAVGLVVTLLGLATLAATVSTAFSML